MARRLRTEGFRKRRKSYVQARFQQSRQMHRLPS